MARRTLQPSPPWWRILTACLAAPVVFIVFTAIAMFTGAYGRLQGVTELSSVLAMMGGLLFVWLFMSTIVALLYFVLRLFGRVTWSGSVVTGMAVAGFINLAIPIISGAWFGLAPTVMITRIAAAVTLGVASGLIFWAAGFAGFKPPNPAEVF